MIFLQYYILNEHYLSTTYLDSGLLGKLAKKERFTNTEMNKLVRHMADQLIMKDPRPGEKGITYTWCSKLVALYPFLGDERACTMMEKTVIYCCMKHQIKKGMCR